MLTKKNYFRIRNFETLHARTTSPVPTLLCLYSCAMPLIIVGVVGWDDPPAHGRYKGAAELRVPAPQIISRHEGDHTPADSPFPKRSPHVP